MDDIANDKEEFDPAALADLGEEIVALAADLRSSEARHCEIHQ